MEQQAHLGKLCSMFVQEGYLGKMDVFLGGEESSTELGDAEGLDVETRRKPGISILLGQSNVLLK